VRIILPYFIRSLLFFENLKVVEVFQRFHRKVLETGFIEIFLLLALIKLVKSAEHLLFVGFWTLVDEVTVVGSLQLVDFGNDFLVIFDGHELFL